MTAAQRLTAEAEAKGRHFSNDAFHEVDAERQ
jgi:hypothetical protein